MAKLLFRDAHEFFPSKFARIIRTYCTNKYLLKFLQARFFWEQHNKLLSAMPYNFRSPVWNGNKENKDKILFFLNWIIRGYTHYVALFAVLSILVIHNAHRSPDFGARLHKIFWIISFFLYLKLWFFFCLLSCHGTWLRTVGHRSVRMADLSAWPGLLVKLQFFDSHGK